MRKHVLLPGDAGHTCEVCGLVVLTAGRGGTVKRACPGKATNETPEHMSGIPENQRHSLRRAGAIWECEVCLRRECRKRLESTKCLGPGAKTKSEILALRNAERTQARRAEENSEARAHNNAVRATGKGQLRHVTVTGEGGEKCEECGRRVPGHFNRARSMAATCPGKPAPLSPEEEERRRRTRASKAAYNERRRLADAEVLARAAARSEAKPSEAKHSAPNPSTSSSSAHTGGGSGERTTMAAAAALGPAARSGGTLSRGSVPRLGPLPASRRMGAMGLRRAGGDYPRSATSGAAVSPAARRNPAPQPAPKVAARPQPASKPAPQPKPKPAPKPAGAPPRPPPRPPRPKAKPPSQKRGRAAPSAPD